MAINYDTTTHQACGPLQLVVVVHDKGKDITSDNDESDLETLEEGNIPEGNLAPAQNKVTEKRPLLSIQECIIMGLLLTCILVPMLLAHVLQSYDEKASAVLTQISKVTTLMLFKYMGYLILLRTGVIGRVYAFVGRNDCPNHG